MKQIIFFVFLLLCANGYTQTFRTAYDILEESNSSNNGQGASYHSNIVSILSNTEFMYLQSYVDMFRATHDVQYIYKFIIHSKRVQERRDDVIKLLPLNQILGFNNIGKTGPAALAPMCIGDQSQIANDILTNSKGWSCIDDNNYCDTTMTYVLHSAEIIYPMAQFVYFMLTDPFFMALSSLAAPAEVGYVQPTTACNINHISTIGDYSNWLKCKINETIDYHNINDWTAAKIPISFLHNFSSRLYNRKNNGNHAELNMQAAMGRVLAIMYEISVLDNNINNTLFQNASKLANLAKSQLKLNSSDASSYTWCHEFNCSNTEDIEHAYLVMSFVDWCVKTQLVDTDYIQPVFNQSDLIKLGNTFSKHIYQAPLTFGLNTLGTNTNIAQGGISLQQYPFLSNYNKYVYQILIDYYAEDALYKNDKGIVEYPQLSLLQSIYNSSNFSYGTNYKFNPIGVRRGHSLNSQCNYLASGDFDNNGLNDFVSVDNANGVFHVYTPDICNDPNLPNNCWVVASSSGHAGNWAGMASADFNSSHAGQELIALNKTTGAIHYFELSGSTFSEQTLNSTVSNWAGITTINGNAAIASDNNGNAYLISVSNGAINNMSLGSMNNHPVSITSGNFDLNNVNPQIAIADNNSGLISIFEFSNNSLNPLYNNVVTAGTYNIWTGLTAGDLDGDGISELVAHRDYDGQVIIYKLKNGTLTAVYGEYFPIDQLNKAMCTARFKLDESKDALVMFRNYDGQITIYNMDGICPSLHLSNQTIDDNYTINNNYSNTTNDYVVDYHSNNVLTANNFTIAGDGSKVDFKAGNLVYLKKGFNAKAGSDFHASIESGLSCSNVNLRTTNNASTAENPLHSHAIQKPSTLVTVYPNPVNNNTNLRVTIPLASKANIVLYNIVGSKIQSILNSQTLEAGNHEFPVDCSSLSAGIYLIEITTETEQIHKQLIVQR